MNEPDQVPCRICGCVEGELGLCHAILIGKKWDRVLTCYRIEPDRCVACDGPGFDAMDAPEDAKRCFARAHWAENAAGFRGARVPGAYALHRHAAEMRLKAKAIIRASLGASGQKTENNPCSGAMNGVGPVVVAFVCMTPSSVGTLLSYVLCGFVRSFLP